MGDSLPLQFFKSLLKRTEYRLYMPANIVIDGKQVVCRRIEVGWRRGKKTGKTTKKAIKEFQKANGLTTDGIVGKQTWLRLKKYLN